MINYIHHVIYFKTAGQEHQHQGFLDIYPKLLNSIYSQTYIPSIVWLTLNLN
jgi:hypothetical protein